MNRVYTGTKNRSWEKGKIKSQEMGKNENEKEERERLLMDVCMLLTFFFIKGNIEHR